MERVEAAEAGFDPERLARIDRVPRRALFRAGAARRSAAADRPGGQGRPLLDGRQGAGRTAGRWREDALFRIASMTKPVTSIAFMMLVEEGKVSLDQPVETVIPEWKGLGVYDGGGAGVPFLARPPERPMMMIDLLRHTSGLTYSFQHRTNVDAAYRETKIERWHGELDLDGFVAALAGYPAGILAGDGLELFGLDRRARPRRRAGVGDEARPFLRRADLRSARNGGHRLPRAAGEDRPARRLLGVSSRARARCFTTKARRAPGAVRRGCSRAAPAWSRPWPIIIVSARCF